MAVLQCDHLSTMLSTATVDIIMKQQETRTTCSMFAPFILLLAINNLNLIVSLLITLLAAVRVQAGKRRRRRRRAIGARFSPANELQLLICLLISRFLVGFVSLYKFPASAFLSFLSFLFTRPKHTVAEFACKIERILNEQ